MPNEDTIILPTVDPSTITPYQAWKNSLKSPAPKSNPELPKMEFNTAAKATKTWYRPATKEDVYAALMQGIVIKEDMYEDDDDAVITWSPIKYSKTLTEKRLKQLRICPDQKYMVMRLGKWDFGGQLVVGWINKRNLQEVEQFAILKGNKWKGWMEPARFVIINKDELYV
jgi:hypothetical protein